MGGVGAIFGGGERDTLHTQGPPDAFAVNAQTEHFGSETKVLGHLGQVSNFGSRDTRDGLMT